MLISHELITFCAQKTHEIAAQYEKSCSEKGFPRSENDLDWLLRGSHHGKQIFERQFTLIDTRSNVRSFYLAFADRYEIYFVSGLDAPHFRYYKTKELFQIVLDRPELATKDLVGDLVHNMRIRSTPAAHNADLGPAATSDTLGDIAAMEFLFPMSERLLHRQSNLGDDGIQVLASKYNIPAWVVQFGIDTIDELATFFAPGACCG